MTTETGFSLQVELIRQIQVENGLVACYATPAAVNCTKKQGECSWSHDCFIDAEEADWDDAAIKATEKSRFENPEKPTGW